MALPLVLIILAVATAFIGVALYVSENYQAGTRSVEVSRKLYNAAQEGLERGKVWIDISVTAGVYPRWSDHDGDGILTDSDVISGDTVVDTLTAWGRNGGGSNEQGHLRLENDGVEVDIRVFDVALEIDSAVAYDPRFPPLVRELAAGMDNVALGQSYHSSNQGQAVIGGGTSAGSWTGRYVIRSEAACKGRREILETAVSVR